MSVRSIQSGRRSLRNLAVPAIAQDREANMTEEHIGQEEFVALAKRILDAKGVPVSTFGSEGRQSMRHEDDLVIIVSHHGGLGLEIERKAQPQSEARHLHVSNPVTMVSKSGEIIRHHGGHAHIAAHMRALAAELGAMP